jgi:hypothetical protein
VQWDHEIPQFYPPSSNIKDHQSAEWIFYIGRGRTGIGCDYSLDNVEAALVRENFLIEKLSCPKLVYSDHSGAIKPTELAHPGVQTISRCASEID